MSSESEAIIATGYDAVYGAIPRSPTLWRIWLDHAAGADFPGDYSHISFVTIGELGELSDALELRADATLADIACGMGGPGLWIAAHVPARVVGVDASAVAVESATERARRLGLGDRSEFRIGTFGATGLPDATADGAISLDALQYAPDKAAALCEFARILKPDARLAFTAFELLADRVADLAVLGDDPVGDYRPVLEAAGFEVERYDETEGWSERLTDAYTAILDNADALTAEMGAAYDSLALEVAVTLERRPYKRRVVATATRGPR